MRREIIVDNFQFGPSGGGPRGESAPRAQTESKPAGKAAQMDTIEYPTEEINPEDIPF